MGGERANNPAGLELSHVVLLLPNAAARSVTLHGQSVTIGSSPTATIQLPEGEPQQAELHRSPTGWVIERGDSSLLVNGKRAKQRELEDGDLIALDRCALSFRRGAAPSASPTRRAPEAGSAVEVCEKLYALAGKLSGGADLDALADGLLADIVALTGASRGSLVMLGENQRPAETRTRTRGALSPAELALSRTAIARVLTEKQPVLWVDTSADSDLARAPSLSGGQARSLMCAPIQRGDRLVAVLYVSQQDALRPFEQRALDLLTLYAKLVGELVADAEERARLARQASDATESLARLREHPVVGRSAAVELVLRQLERVAPTDLPVVLHGETGTGKELFARELHRRSARAAGPFVAVNCGAIPEALLESELFGHVKGAFTDAHTDRVGHLRAAHGGTLLLDEVGEMPLSQQAKLLRVLQDQLVTPVGGERPQRVDFRLVCATNRNLEERVREGKFREDLWFRIAGLVIKLPPLRERGEDVVDLAEHFLGKQRLLLDRPRLQLSAAALTAIRSHRWAGNVRELEAAVRRAAALAQGDVVEPEALGLAPPGADRIKPLSQVRDEFLKEYVRDVVHRMGDNRTAAAERLGVTPRTIFKYLEEI